MIIYSKKIIQLIAEIKRSLKIILKDEVGVKVSGDRFTVGNCSYPIKIVIFNHKKQLGYFDPQFFEIGLHERLRGKELENTLRHEIAHYIVFIRHGDTQSHGVLFKDFCESLGWGEEVYKATTCLDEGWGEEEENPILRKIKKLMALSSSGNPHEAEEAMLKARELLLKHNIDETVLDEKYVLKRIMQVKRENAKMRAIALILETFFVNVVFSRGVDCTCLEIVGDSSNVEIAEHVASLLERELENLWDKVALKGRVEKNSFFLGFAEGYCHKVGALKKESSPETRHGLMVIEGKLIEAKEMVYDKLRSSKSRHKFSPEAAALGKIFGNNFQIQPAVPKKPSILIEMS